MHYSHRTFPCRHLTLKLEGPCCMFNRALMEILSRMPYEKGNLLSRINGRVWLHTMGKDLACKRYVSGKKRIWSKYKAAGTDPHNLLWYQKDIAVCLGQNISNQHGVTLRQNLENSSKRAKRSSDLCFIHSVSLSMDVEWTRKLKWHHIYGWDILYSCQWTTNKFSKSVL